ncbi:hypothetical protein Tco_1193812 [Tanacetum coccineum]
MFNGDDVNAWLFRVQQFYLIDGDDHKTRLKLGKGFPFHEIRDDQHEGEKAKKKHLIGKSSSIPSTQTTDKQVEKQTTGNTVAVEEMNVGLMLISEVATEALEEKEVIYLVSDDEMDWVHDENYDTKPEPTGRKGIYDEATESCHECTLRLVIQDHGDYEFEIYLNNTRPYPPPLLVFDPSNRPHRRITDYRNFDLLFLRKGSKAKMGLKPSINRAWAVDFDEDDIEEIFEKRFRSEVATEFDPNAYHDIERWEDRHKFFYR